MILSMRVFTSPGGLPRKVLEQHVTSSGELARVVEELLQDDPARAKMAEGMAALDRPESATQIAGRILRRL